MNLSIAQNLQNQTDFLSDWHNFLSVFDNHHLDNIAKPPHIQHYVNGKNLACPMPLLKLKMALKTTEMSNAVFVSATDPDSEKDIMAFCQHANLSCICQKFLQNSDNMPIFYLLVVKIG